MTREQIALLATVFCVQGVAVGVSFGAAPVFVAPIREAFDAPISQISWGVSLIALMLGVMGPIWGRWIDRGEFRRIMLTGSTLASACLLGASAAPSLSVLALLCIGMGIAVPLIGPLACSSLIGKVFVEARGSAMGIASMGPPFGGAAFAFLAGELIPRTDWRTTFQVFSLLCTLTIPLIYWKIPRKVEPLAVPDQGGGRWTTARLLRTRDFWGAAMAMGIGAGVASGWGYHLVSFTLDLGHDLAEGARIAALAGLVGIVGTVVFGVLADRFQAKWLLFGTLFGQVTAFGVYLTEPDYPGLLAAAVLFGICGGSLVTLYALILTQRFGPAALGQALGVTNLFVLPFGVLSSPVAGWLREQTASYAAPILVLGGLLVVAALSLLLIRRPERVEEISPAGAGVPLDL